MNFSLKLVKLSMSHINVNNFSLPSDPIETVGPLYCYRPDSLPDFHELGGGNPSNPPSLAPTYASPPHPIRSDSAIVPVFWNGRYF